MYLLRLHFGIGWQESEDMPAWEVDALLAELYAEVNRARKNSA